MSIPDEELQRMVEQGGHTSSSDPEALAYQKLFGLLAEPSAYRPRGMEDAIIARIEISRKRSAIREHFWLVAGIVFLVLVAVGAVAFSGFHIVLSGWQQSILALGTCATFVILLLNAVERKLLHH